MAVWRDIWHGTGGSGRRLRSRLGDITVTTRGRWCTPCPRTATNSTPVPPEFVLESSAVAVELVVVFSSHQLDQLFICVYKVQVCNVGYQKTKQDARPEDPPGTRMVASINSLQKQCRVQDYVLVIRSLYLIPQWRAIQIQYVATVALH